MESRALVSWMWNFLGSESCSFSYFCWYIGPYYFIVSDVNECSSDTLSANHTHYANNCHNDANCTNTKGSYYCTCLNGYSGNGVSCTGKITIDVSFNVFFFFSCALLFSYLRLVDVNECETDEISDYYKYLAHNCHNDSICTNTNGSFYCTCLVGYSGDGVWCSGE